MLVKLEQVTKSVEKRIMLDSIFLEVGQGERIGLVGAPGSGKSTLLKMIHGDLKPDEGTLWVQEGVEIGLLGQKEELHGPVRVREALGREGIPAKRITQVLKGLGQREVELEMLCSDLSRRSQRLLALARQLVLAPALLLLDRPERLLDTKGLEFLEEQLQHYPGTLLVCCHERFFMDQVCTKIWCFEQQRCDVYPVTYSHFVAMRRVLMSRDSQQYFLRSRFLDSLVETVREGIPHSIYAQNDLRLALHYESPPLFERMLVAKNLSIYLGREPTGELACEGISLEIREKDRIGVVCEPSVATSLIETLAGRREPAKGELQRSEGVTIGMISQDNLNLRNYKSAVQEVWDRQPKTYEEDVRRLLHCAGLSDNRVERRLDELCEGERARLKIAVLMNEMGNLLLLDHPERNIDPLTCEMLEMILKSFSGTMLFASDDRYLMQRLAKRIFVQEGKQLKEISEDYSSLRTKRRKSAIKPIKPLIPIPKRIRARINFREGLVIQMRLLEVEILKLEEQIVRLHAELKKSTCSGDHALTKTLCEEISAVRNVWFSTRITWALSAYPLEQLNDYEESLHPSKGPQPFHPK